MEDISRELEREIAHSKPKPYKLDRKTSVIIVDDFGQMKSGEYLRRGVKLLSVLSIIFFVSAAVFYFLFSNLSREASSIKEKLVSVEKQINDVIREKEILMAKLVISGKVLEGEKEGKAEDRSIPLKGGKKNRIDDGLTAISESPEPPTENDEPAMEMKKRIDIERFTLKKDAENGDLLAIFDIRNITTDLGDISGRVFTVLKPENTLEDQWLVVPEAAIKKGIPSEYKKGQYFSISHFKPMKFRIKNQTDPDFFKKAAIYIFNEQADLIFEKGIDLTGEE